MFYREEQRVQLQQTYHQKRKLKDNGARILNYWKDKKYKKNPVNVQVYS